MDLRETPSCTVNRHPWELARVTALRRIAQDYQLLPSGARILDLGCGDGFIADTLCPERGISVDAVDINLTPDQLIAFSHARPRITFHNSYHSLGKNQFTVLTLFDVLEHVADDAAFLGGTISRFAMPGARLFCTVPAFQSLFCAHDRFLKHHRRYTLNSLHQLLSAVGLRVQASGYLFGSLLPARTLTVVTERLLRSSASPPGIGHWHHGPLLTSAITSLLNADNRALLALSKIGITFPGLTVWALCETPR